ncbi:MAG: hypothetical protein ACOCQR_01995 [bacterium]
MTKERITIGLDLGYSYTKIVGDNNKKTIFPSFAVESSTSVFQSTGVMVEKKPFNSKQALRNLQVTYNGVDYYVGRSALNQSRNADSLLTSGRVGTEQELILGLTAIALISSSDDISVDGLMLGLPISEMNMLGNKLKTMYSGIHSVKLTNIQNGQSVEKKIYIDDVRVIQQSVAALYSEVFDLKGKPKTDKRRPELREEVGIIDIGYRTTDFVVAEQLSLKNHLSDTLEIGISNVHEEVRRVLKQKYNFERNLSQIEKYVQKKKIVLDGRNIDLTRNINDAKKAVASQIATEIKNSWRDDVREFSTILLVGGGSVALGASLIQEFTAQAEVIDDAQMANAKGYLAFYKAQKNLEEKRQTQQTS